MSKDDLIALIQAQKDAKIASVSADYDALLSAANSLEVAPVDPDVAALQAQVLDLTGKLDAANAEVAKDVQAIADEKSVEEKLQAKIDAIKAALEA